MAELYGAFGELLYLLFHLIESVELASGNAGLRRDIVVATGRLMDLMDPEPKVLTSMVCIQFLRMLSIY